MTTNADLLTRRNAAVVRGIGHTTPLSASRARNAELWDVEGKRYIDFAGGIEVVNTGHCHPRIIAAVQEQMERFTLSGRSGERPGHGTERHFTSGDQTDLEA